MDKMRKFVNVALDTRWWRFYLQRRVHDPTRRNKIANTLARFRPQGDIQNFSRARAGAAALRETGLLDLGQLLTKEQSEELRIYFEHKKVRDPYRASVPHFLPLSDKRPPQAHIAHHQAEDIISAPYLLDLANDPGIVDVVSDFLGCKPTIGYIATWWSYATGLGAQQAENYHRDVDDWRFVKLFVYLTDVDEESGPHKYVTNSSAAPKLTDIRRFDDDEVAETFGVNNIKTMTAKAGEGFLEDTYGIHKGQPVQSGFRLLFQVVYTLTPLPYAPKAPVAEHRPDSGHDQWTNRVYLK